MMVALLKGIDSFVLAEELFHDRFDCLLVNECFEFARYQANRYNPRLLLRKLEFAIELFDYGFVEHSVNYCEQIKHVLYDSGLVDVKQLQENTSLMKASPLSQFLIPSSLIAEDEDSEQTRTDNLNILRDLWSYQMLKMLTRVDRARNESFWPPFIESLFKKTQNDEVVDEDHDDGDVDEETDNTLNKVTDAETLSSVEPSSSEQSTPARKSLPKKSIENRRASLQTKNVHANNVHQASSNATSQHTEEVTEVVDGEEDEDESLSVSFPSIAHDDLNQSKHMSSTLNENVSADVSVAKHELTPSSPGPSDNFQQNQSSTQENVNSFNQQNSFERTSYNDSSKNASVLDSKFIVFSLPLMLMLVLFQVQIHCIPIKTLPVLMVNNNLHLEIRFRHQVSKLIMFHHLNYKTLEQPAFKVVLSIMVTMIKHHP